MGLNAFPSTQYEHGMLSFSSRFVSHWYNVSPSRLTRLGSMIANLHFLYMKENGTVVGAEMALVTFCCLPPYLTTTT